MSRGGRVVFLFECQTKLDRGDDTAQTIQTGHKHFATLRASILQIPLALQNGPGLKVSETHFTFTKSYLEFFIFFLEL